jgi:ABC-type glycerol-3-phosphate transport system substrate-binding protein
VVTGANFLNMIKENAPSVYENTIVLPQLTGETGKYDFSLMNFVIPKRAHNKEAAVKFATYLTNKEYQLEFSKLTTILPVNKYTLEDEYFSEETEKDLQSRARVISANQLNYLQPPLNNINNKKELNTLSTNYIQEILINNAEIKSTLDQFSENWSKL